MKYMFSVLMLACLVLVGCDAQRDIELQDLDGNTIVFHDEPQEWLVLNYWASWCQPCYKEIPELNKFIDKNRDRVILLGVSYDRAPVESIGDIAESMGINFPTIAGDPTAALGLPHVTVLPATYIFNEKGQLVAELLGEQTQASLEEALGIS